MGAQAFQQFEQRESDQDTLIKAFYRAREQAQWNHGHSGYSGTLAEKDKVTLIPGILTYTVAEAFADQLMQDNDARISDKWGPAGAIQVKGDTRRVFRAGLSTDPQTGYHEVEYDGWLFFGFASS